MENIDLQEARSYVNYLLTLSIRREEAFGALAFTFIKENDMKALGLLPEEQFNLLMAIIQAFAPEPKRYTQKLELLKRAKELQKQTRYSNPELIRQLEFDTLKTQAELDIYDEAIALRPLFLIYQITYSKFCHHNHYTLFLRKVKFIKVGMNLVQIGMRNLSHYC